MTLKKGIITLVLAVFALKNHAQHITVKADENKEVLPYAQVSFYDKNKSRINATTNQKGEVNIPKNLSFPVELSISFVNFKTLKDTLETAENKTYYLTASKINLDEVVVTAQYAPGSAEQAVHKVKVINREKIDAMGAQNLKDVLTNELNIRLSQDNILGSSMSLQGISGQNIKILIDGVPVTGRLNGNIDISQINMNNVERIEIVEGPLSVNYGTDALGGTINIITKKSQQNQYLIQSDNYYESVGHYNTTGRVGIQKEKHQIAISGGRQYFDGWRNDESPFHMEKTRVADTLRVKDWKPKEQYFGNLTYMHYFDKLSLRISSDYFTEEITNRGMPRLPYYENAFDDYYNTTRSSNSINLNGQITEKYYLKFLAAYTHFKREKNTYFNDLTTLEQELSQTPGDQDTSIFNNIVSRASISKNAVNATLNYEIGYDINHETGIGKRIADNRQQIGDYAMFTSAEYKPFSQFIIRPGVRVIYNTAYTAPVVPSLNVKHTAELKNNAEIVWRLSYARGFRAPSLKELYFYFVDVNHNITGNENLKAEHSNNYNATVNFLKKKDKYSWRFELSGFYNAINNMITLAQGDGQAFSYFNLNQYQTHGTQLQSELRFKALDVSAGFAYVGRYNQLSEAYSTAKYIYSPEARGGINYRVPKHNLSMALFYKYTGALPAFRIQNDEISESIIEAYSLSDASITKGFFAKKVNLTLGVKNIFNVSNISGVATGGAHSSSSNSLQIAMGRTYFLKLNINVSK